ncbi:Conserved hypothetical protein [Bacteriophage APSE-3]|nr:Conserved hypothetical protein [Bacteriophage APSE-3]
MTQQTQCDNPNDIDSFSVLKIKTVSGNLSPSIYANGNNRLPIQITAKAVKIVKIVNGTDIIEENIPLRFSHKTWISILNLRFAESDEKLNREGSSGWCFTGDKNDYSKEIQAGSHRRKRVVTNDDGTVFITMYVYTFDVDTKRIAVSVDTNNGKHFTTADNASSVETMDLSVQSLLPINYGLSDNITVRGMPTSINDFSEIVSDMWINTGGDQFANHADYYTGVSSRKQFTIHPKKEGLVFHSAYTRRNNADLSSCRFPNNIKPDMIRGTGGLNFDTQFIFVNQQTYGILPESAIEVRWRDGATYKYLVGSRDDRHHWNDRLEYGFITVNICNHRIPWGNMTKLYGLVNEGRLIQVDVTDNYGNSGVIEIKAPGNDDSWPKLQVNGV